jgi:DNA-binding transcriptional LysR family regulator
MNELQVLVAIAEEGSVSGAALALALSRATVRRRVEELVARGGGAVFVRDGHAVVLTARGTVLVEQGRRLLRETEAVFRTARQTHALQGELTLAHSLGIPADAVATGYRLLSAAVPGVRLTLKSAMHPVRLLPDTADLALHVGSTLPDGPHAAWVCARVTEQLLATPNYLEAAGEPSTLEELMEHPLFISGLEDALPLRGGGTLSVRAQVRSLDAQHVRGLALADAGIALAPHRDHPMDVGLVPVLPDEVRREQRVWVVVPEALSGNPMIQQLKQVLSSVL